MAVEKSDKKFSEYKQSKPKQLSLFYLLDEHPDNFSQTIELYDFVPKYVLGRLEDVRVDGRYLEPIKRDFECRGKEYQLTLLPARLEIENGVFKDFFLGVREEIVEDALRKLAVEGKGIMLDDELGMSFSIYQIEKEVSSTGHTYSFTQIMDALKILATATIKISSKTESDSLLPVKGKKSKSGKDLFFHPLETLAFDNDRKETPTFVRFSPLVTKSIRENSFRMINYRESMKLRSFLARQLYKRMSHHFIQASITQPYSILLTTIIRDLGLTLQSRLKNNLVNVEDALKEMEKNFLILGYKVEKVFDTKRKNKMVDALLHITPSPTFARDAKKFNARTAQNRRLLSEND